MTTTELVAEQTCTDTADVAVLVEWLGCDPVAERPRDIVGELHDQLNHRSECTVPELWVDPALEQSWEGI